MLRKILSHTKNLSLPDDAARFRHGLREIRLLAFLSLAVYLLVAGLSYDLEDPGWRHTGTGRPLTNDGGLVGAWLADFAYTLFGVMFLLVPLLVAWYGWASYRRGSWWWVGSLQAAIRTLGFVATLVGGAGLAYLHFPRTALDLPETSGGLLGIGVGEWLLSHFGPVGATLALLVLFLAGITLLTGLSWLDLMETIGKYVLLAWDWLWLQAGALAAAWRRQRVASSGERMAVAEAAPAALQEPRLALPEEIVVAEPELRLAGTEEEGEPPSLTAVEEDAGEVLDVPFETAPEPEEAAPSPALEAAAVLPDIPPVIGRKVETHAVAPKAPSEPVLPSLDLLDEGNGKVEGYSEADLALMSRQLEAVLADFGVQAKVREVHPGPVITRFEIQPGPGIKGSRISNLATDLARSLSVSSVRVVEVIPGKSYIGLEVPNRQRETVYLREVLSSREYQKSKSPVTLVLGKDISGRPVVADLARMPHLLVAGTTGSGKSVAINAMILSMLYKATPAQVRLIMIDPKMLELSVYEGIPHLLAPVVTDMKEAASALRWCVAEMDRRYRLMSALRVRNLDSFNRKVGEAAERGEPIKDPFFRAGDLEEGGSWPLLEPLPVIVVIIDELADMMMIVGKKVEELIARLAQKARAAGIHLILATQRPSVDVITGLIKANVPTRIAFQVSSKVDSRTILDQGGAETLLGCGDMLYLPPGTGFPIRAHGAFVDDEEVIRVVGFLKQTGQADYIEEITRFQDETDAETGGDDDDAETDALYDAAVRFVTETRRVSTSSIQRKFKIGYNRAARIVEAMERAGVVSPPEGNGARTVLAPPPHED
ncbi:DNA segregation ATPase FtsK/SpoIIIE, S-DNA-T family [Methylomarinovum tepidoasis]|uniref:DNA translocase FtsK n=1 Tax=Methylomarinovum tepidoasis TaxID=2840183 RepID=A0AAU9C0T7_9GAMM|nr:DNA translocase FtsK [Methylomarinovum sp. IN45]BCX89533.1 DNA segregation ATPase FtsK/SpoIIIE, S-DNA-T family [Methylomarinovum sp. IN45]